MGNTFQKMVVSDPFPETEGTPRFDPQFGFTAERKKRVMQVSEEDLIAAKVPKRYRDFCAHLFLEHRRCYVKKFPFVQNCRTEVHKYLDCEHEDYILRMKEYERERRLLIREKEKQEALKKAAAA